MNRDIDHVNTTLRLISYLQTIFRRPSATFISCESPGKGYCSAHGYRTPVPMRVNALVLFFVLLATIDLAKADSPDNVHALVYSVTTAELFFVPRPGQLTRVSRNGRHIGTFDSRSLLITDLDPSQQYRFDLQSESPQGEVAAQSRVVEIATGDFTGAPRLIGSLLENAIDVSGQVSGEAAETAAEVSEEQPQPTAVELSLPAPPDIAQVTGSETPDALCEALGASLAQAVENFAAQCVTHVREDCDPLDNGWLCSSETIGSGSARVTQSASTENTVDNQAAATSDQNDAVVDSQAQQPASPAPVVTAPPAPVAPPAPAAPTTPISNPTNGGCEARSLSQLRDCINRNSNLITIQQNFSCSGDACCAGGATLSMVGRNNIRFEGNGHRLTRNAGHRQCHLLDMRQSSNVTFNNWVLDDNASVQPCQVTDRCPHMLDIRGSNAIRMSNVSILNSKGYATWLQGVNGFSFDRGEVRNSGVLGMYIGHTGQPSRNIQVRNSRFLFNQTNGLALLGLTGSRAANQVSGNLFIGNHWGGQFQVAPQFGTGFTGGGQVYIAQANGLTFNNNTIRHGYCVNCLVTAGAGSGVTALELGLPNQDSVRNVTINGNTLENHDAWGVGANTGTRIGSDIAVTNNTIRNVRRAVVGSGYSQSGNRIAETDRVISFEGNDAELNPGSWTGSGTVRQQCGGASLGGRCVIELTASAGGSSQFSSARFNVNGRRQVTLSGWVRGRGAQLCLAFVQTNGSESRQCRSLDNNVGGSPINGFGGFETVNMNVPQGVSEARLQVIVPGGQQISLDDLKLAFN